MIIKLTMTYCISHKLFIKLMKHFKSCDDFGKDKQFVIAMTHLILDLNILNYLIIEIRYHDTFNMFQKYKALIFLSIFKIYHNGLNL